MEDSIKGIVGFLIFLAIGLWLTKEKKEDHGHALNRLGNRPAAGSSSHSVVSEQPVEWGWVILVILVLAGISGGILGLFAAIGLIPACIAKKRGGSFTGWWLYGSGLFLIALPHALWFLDDATKRRCNFCKEPVHLDATICPHCRNNPRALTAS
jgi:hypothetical protein